MRILYSYTVSVALVLSSWTQLSNGSTLRRREVDAPSSTDFIRRSFAAATVIGDFVYIDGGEVSQLVDGEQPPSDRPSYPVNSTLSISLREPWTNSTVSFGSVSKQGAANAPVLNNQAIWTDLSSNSFWIWGGSAASPNEPPEDESWEFFADGNGGGFWSIKVPSNQRAFDELSRPDGCAFTQSTEVGYCMGGLVTAQSNATVTSDIAVPGLVSMGMESTVWTNTSTTGFGRFGTMVNGAAEFVPFGPNGLIMLLGGAEGQSNNFAASSIDLDFANITFYDPITQQWFSQATTGEQPTRRQSFCTVGVQGPNNTYEIFLYGGLETAAVTTSDEVFVLSLPGFVFTKANSTTSTPRADHACVAVGSGKRQMLSIGGINAAKGYPESMTDPDPWAQGLGVFDMTALEWKAAYDAEAAPYDTPEAVKQFYRNGGLSAVAWTNDEVEKLFTTGNKPDFGSGVGGDGGGSTGGNDAGSGNSRNTLPLGAVIGIAIGGGLFVLGVAAAFLFCALRRRREAFTFSFLPYRNPSGTTTSSANSQPATASISRTHTATSSVSSTAPLNLRRPSRSVTDLHAPDTPARWDKTAPPVDGYSVFIKGNATPIVPMASASSSSMPLASNPITLKSALASRRGRPALRAIRTATAEEVRRTGSIRVYQKFDG